MDRSTADYLAQGRCARQWKGFLSVLGTELSEQLSQDALRLLFYRMGTRFGSQNPVTPTDSVVEMQASMAAIWDAVDWGVVSLEEADAALVISHFCSPLVAAFGPSLQTRVPAFLEGVYQEWFTQLGSSEILRVKQVSDADEFGSIKYRLARH